MNPLSLLGTGGSIAAALALALSLAGGAWAVVHEHDAKVIAQVAAQQAAVAAQAQHDQDQQVIAGLTMAAQKAAALASTMTKLKETIHATPTTNACANSPAIIALTSWLRSSSGGSDAHTAPTTAGGSVAVPSPAGAAGGR